MPTNQYSYLEVDHLVCQADGTLGSQHIHVDGHTERLLLEHTYRHVTHSTHYLSQYKLHCNIIGGEVGIIYSRNCVIENKNFH